MGKEGRGASATPSRAAVRGPMRGRRRDLRGDPPLLGVRRRGYSRYGLRANPRTYLATFRRSPRSTHTRATSSWPARGDDARRGGEMVRRRQGRRSYDEALLCRRSPCDRRRSPAACRDFTESQPSSPACRAPRPALAREGTATTSQALMFGAHTPTRCRRPPRATGLARHENV